MTQENALSTPEHVYTLGSMSYEREFSYVTVYRTLAGAQADAEKWRGRVIDWEHDGKDTWEEPWLEYQESACVIRRCEVRG